MILDRHDDKIHLTEAVLKAAVKDPMCDYSNLALMFHRRDDEVHITESLLKLVAGMRHHGIRKTKLSSISESMLFQSQKISSMLQHEIARMV